MIAAPVRHHATRRPDRSTGGRWPKMGATAWQALTLLGLCAACPATNTQEQTTTAVSRARTPNEAEPRTPKSAPQKPAASDEPTLGKPFRRPGDVARGYDEFLFWGWSEDGRYFAFETWHAGPGMADCEGEAEFTIVDATTDRYAEDGHLLLKHARPEADKCDPPDLRGELALRRDPRLARLGISPARGSGPITIEGSGTDFRFTLPSNETVEVTFEVLHAATDPGDAIDGAAYMLRMTPPGATEVTIEPGKRRRPWTLGYSLDDGMVFVGPNGEHAALMVAQRQVMAEGVRTTWMANGVSLR